MGSEEQASVPPPAPSPGLSPSQSKLKQLCKPMSWLRKSKGGASFNGYEVREEAGCEVDQSYALASDDEARVRNRSGENSGASDTTRQEGLQGNSVQSRSVKERRKYDPRRYVRSARSAHFATMGCPPRGYLWLWLGHFKRWHRRFFVLATPGALTCGKRPDMKAGKWTMHLGGASVSVGKGNSRQFCLRTSQRVVYLRTLSREDRELWVAYLVRSIEKYGEMVERTKQFATRSLSRISEDPRNYSLEAEVDPHMLKMQRDLWAHMQSKMLALQEHREELEAHLGHIANGMNQALSALGQQPSLVGGEQRMGEAQQSNPGASGFGGPSNAGGGSVVVGGGEICASPHEALPGRPSGCTSGNAWEAYTNLTSAVEQVIREEALRVIELQAENRALRALLRDRYADPRALGGRGSSSFRTTLIGQQLRDEQFVRTLDDEAVDTSSQSSSSRTYSTAGSQFVHEDDDDEFLEFKTGDLREEAAMDSTSRTMLDDDLIAALEVVRQVEYVTKGPVMSEFDGDVEGEEPPMDGLDGEEEMELGGHEDSDTSSPMATVARTRLPCPRPLRRGFSIWSVLKNAIGRDLTRITLPATINEPLSALQRVAEEFEYYHLLERAATCSDPQERLAFVTAFVLSSYNSGLLRDNKPFNPLLGETYEWQDENLQFIAEQVSHHPPISCFHSKGINSSNGDPLFTLHGEFELRSKFWGKTLSVFPTGRCELTLLNERYMWNKSYISIHNIIIGTLWLDFHGEIQIQNLSSGAKATVNIPKCGWSLDKRGKVEGCVQKSDGEVTHRIYGNYRTTINAKCVQSEAGAGAGGGEEIEIFRCNDPPEDMQEQYNMTTFAIGLNDFQKMGSGNLPKTDARFRPDVRALENGEFDLATSEKLRLEEKQRQARRERKDSGLKYYPMWFRKRNETDKDLVKTINRPEPSAWEFSEEYWSKKTWGNCPDIY